MRMVGVMTDDRNDSGLRVALEEFVNDTILRDRRNLGALDVAADLRGLLDAHPALTEPTVVEYEAAHPTHHTLKERLHEVAYGGQPAPESVEREIDDA